MLLLCSFISAWCSNIHAKNTQWLGYFIDLIVWQYFKESICSSTESKRTEQIVNAYASSPIPLRPVIGAFCCSVHLGSRSPSRKCDFYDRLLAQYYTAKVSHTWEMNQACSANRWKQHGSMARPKSTTMGIVKYQRKDQ